MTFAAPLQLIGYQVQELSLERVFPKESDADPLGFALGFGIESRPVEGEENAYELELTVEFNKDEEQIPEDAEGQIYHRGRVTLVGRFTWVRESFPDDPDEAEKLLLVNGLSMLYGTARVHLQQLTEPGPGQVLRLPSVSFLPIVEEWLESDEELPETTSEEEL